MSRFNLFLVPLFLFSITAHAAGARVDYDLDDDGLIEINDLDDLNEIRNNLDGTSLYADNTGCPVLGCNGFELSTSLNFDSNNDGVFDINDSYWNTGSGWVAIGTTTTPFTAIFEGNDFSIQNLVINRQYTSNQGLFAFATNATFRNVFLNGELSSIYGRDAVASLAGNVTSTNIDACSSSINIRSSGDETGGLVGITLNSDIKNSSSTGDLLGRGNAGGLIGLLQSTSVTNSYATGTVLVTGYYGGGLVGQSLDSTITSSYATGAITAYSSNVGGLIGTAINTSITASYALGQISSTSDNVGGLIGSLISGSSVSASYAVGNAAGRYYVGGLIGNEVSSSVNASFSIGAPTGRNSVGGLIGRNALSTVVDSYWARDSSGINTGTAGTPYILSELTCPISANDTTCAASTLYANWETFTDAQNTPYWDFGTANQLPGLVINAVTHRDSDGDAVLDSVDAFPFNYAASVDLDSDGAADRWKADCDNTCQAGSGLVLDQMPGFFAAIIDADLDGLPDQWNVNCDAACITASGLTIDTNPGDTDNDGTLDNIDTDDNGDGIIDADANSNGLIDVSSLAELDAIRNNLNGNFQSMSAGLSDATGCPVEIVDGVSQFVCGGYELIADLDFDTNSDAAFTDADTYWNNGLGWQAIGSRSIPFKAVFEGNNHIIHNLVINRPDASEQGLFGGINQAVIQNIKFEGGLTSIIAFDTLGIVAGHSMSSQLANVHASGALSGLRTSTSIIGGLVGNSLATTFTGSSTNVQIVSEGDIVGGLVGDLNSYTNTPGEILESYSTVSINSNRGQVGGLVGKVSDSIITASFSTGHILAAGNSNGGLVGKVPSNGTVKASFSSVRVTSGGYSGGLVGEISGSGMVEASYSVGQVKPYISWVGGLTGGSRGTVVDSYWAIDSSGQSQNYIGGTGVQLAELACPVSSDDSVCAATPLYTNWATYTDTTGNAYWDYGSTNELPGLLINGVIYRDGDGDGVLDSVDAFPASFAASIDSDGDGAADAWTVNCDTACQLVSGLKLDHFPSNAAASFDTDLDGLADTWNTGCDATCISASGLTLDTSLNDSDNDGIDNITDTDDNNDGVIDIDADSDGLIEISTLQELDAIRFDPTGNSKKLDALSAGDSSGCPGAVIDGVMQHVCSGYELTQDLDFDTNQDGVLNELDSFWNNAEGWVAIGTYAAPFTGVLEGNSHLIRNLMTNRPTEYYQALFGRTQNATIRNLGLNGELMSIRGNGTSAGIIGIAFKTLVESSFVSGDIQSTEGSAAGLVAYASEGTTVRGGFFNGQVSSLSQAGGLVAYATSSHIEASFSTGVINSTGYSGGLVGYLKDSTVSNSYSTAQVADGTNAGGLVGALIGDTTAVINSYWAIDVSGQSGLIAGQGFSLAELQCPTTADDLSCAASSIYTGWANDRDSAGNPYWNFGTSSQMPALVLNGLSYRDSDGDGVFDDSDAFADNIAASKDTDGDLAPDFWTAGCDSACITSSGLVLDNFPANDAVSVDTDLDGLPDAWNASCDSSCQSASGLTIDLFKDDFDNDGIIDSIDNDDNADGIVDVDVDSNGLIEINNLHDLNAMRFSLSGRFKQSAIDTLADNSGCPVVILEGKLSRSCKGYELTTDLDFDSDGNQQLNASDSYWNAGLGWESIGSVEQPFNAVLEGNGFVLRNLMINRPSNDYQGLLAYVSGATIQNMGLTGNLMSVSGAENVGGFAGYATSTTLSHVFSEGQISAQGYIGGLVGEMRYGSVNGSYVSGSINASSSYAGGLVGYAYSVDILESRFVNGSVLSTDSNVGGLLGFLNNGVIRSSYVSGSVTGTSIVGGIAGRTHLVNGTALFVTGSVTGSSSYVSGIFGYVTDTTIEASFATGLISSNSINSIEGIAGYTASSSIDSYWATDSTAAPADQSGALGATLAELQCPTTGDDTGCAAIELYTNWATHLNTEGVAYWDFGSNGQLPGLNIGGLVHRDSDGDSELDFTDVYPLDPTESLDTDNDNIGNNADTDDDNDGVADTLDLFPLDATESTDLDADGIGDNTDVDDDNDGVLDINDPDNSSDNGQPVIVSTLPVNLNATGELTNFNLISISDGNIQAVDVVDSVLTLEASLNGEILTPVSDLVSLPTGALSLQWVAIDTAGNRSEPVEQLVNVYPQVGFTLSDSITGEPSVAKLAVSLTGQSPEYPIVIEFNVFEQTATFDDIDPAFFAAQTITLTIENEQAMADAALSVPVIDESLAEVNETMLFEIVSAQAGAQGIVMPIANDVINNDRYQHQLTITETNLPPVLSLSMSQAGEEVLSIDQKAGEVTITVVVEDPNGNDLHTLAWDLAELNLSAEDVVSFSFDPANMQDGLYNITTIATDNGVEPLSTELMTIVVVERKNISTSEGSSNTGGGGGGSVNALLLMLMLSVFVFRSRYKY